MRGSVVPAGLSSSAEADWEKPEREPAERFSGRMGPFSGSDQVSVVVKLSLFGRKNSKHEPMKAAHPSAWLSSRCCHERPVLQPRLFGVFSFCDIEILIKAFSPLRGSPARSTERL